MPGSRTPGIPLLTVSLLRVRSGRSHLPAASVGDPEHTLSGPFLPALTGEWSGADTAAERPYGMDYEYIATADRLKAAVNRLRNESRLGVDTEAAGYHRYLDRMSLVQISSDDENLLVDPLAIDDLSALAAIFEDPNIEKIFHDADYDLRILDRDAGLRIKNLFDTQIAAAFLGERSLGLGAIVEKYLGISLPKAFQRADWAERPLSQGMKDYAATDTVHLPPLRDRLSEELEARGRRGWAEEEFERREGTRWTPGTGETEAFLRMKGARDLPPRGLAILRELHAWREKVAEERDQATFRILSNQALLELSLKAPSARGELTAISGISEGLADRRGRELLEAIRRGVEVPEKDLPRFPQAKRWERDPDVETRAENLRQVRNEVADRLGLDPGFLISRAQLDEVARSNPQAPEELLDVPDIRQWQVEVLGDAILRTLR